MRRRRIRDAVLRIIPIGAALALSLVVPTGSAESFPDDAAILGSGRLAGFRWHAYAFRKLRDQPTDSACLGVDIVPLRRGPSVEQFPLGATQCGDLRSRPNILSLINELNHPKITVIALAFRAEARSVSLYFNGRIRDRTVYLLSLSTRKALKASVFPFRYSTIAFFGKSCLSRFVVHADDGRVLEDGGHMDCRVRTQ